MGRSVFFVWWEVMSTWKSSIDWTQLLADYLQLLANLEIKNWNESKQFYDRVIKKSPNKCRAGL